MLKIVSLITLALQIGFNINAQSALFRFDGTNKCAGKTYFAEIEHYGVFYVSNENIVEYSYQENFQTATEVTRVSNYQIANVPITIPENLEPGRIYFRVRTTSPALIGSATQHMLFTSNSISITIESNSDFELCYSESIQLKIAEADNFSEFTWSTNETTELINLDWNQTDTIFCQAIHYSGCLVKTDTVNIINNPKLQYNIQYDSNIIHDTRFTIMAEGGKNHHWMPEKYFASPDSAVTFAQLLDTTELFLELYDDIGCKYTDTFTINLDKNKEPRRLWDWVYSADTATVARMDKLVAQNGFIFGLGSFQQGIVEIGKEKSNDEDGLFIVSLDENKNTIWTKYIENISRSYSLIPDEYHLVIDSNNLFLVGNIAQEISIDGQLFKPSSKNKYNQYIPEIFIAKFGYNGELESFYNFPNSIGGEALVTDVKFDKEGDIVFSGIYAKTTQVADYILNPHNDTYSQYNTASAFIAKCNKSDYNISWLKTFGGAPGYPYDYNHITDIGIDNKNDIYIGGNHHGELIMGDHEVTSFTEQSFFGKIRSDGTPVWLKTIDADNNVISNDGNYIVDLVVDNLNNLFIAVRCNDDIAGIEEYIIEDNNSSIYLFKISPQGEVLFHLKGAYSGFSGYGGYPYGLDIDTLNNVYLTSLNNNSSDFINYRFDTKPYGYWQEIDDLYFSKEDLVTVMKLDNNGVVQWVEKVDIINDFHNVPLPSCSFIEHNNFYLGGKFDAPIITINDTTFPNAQFDNFYILKLNLGAQNDDDDIKSKDLCKYQEHLLEDYLPEYFRPDSFLVKFSTTDTSYVVHSYIIDDSVKFLFPASIKVNEDYIMTIESSSPYKYNFQYQYPLSVLNCDRDVFISLSDSLCIDDEYQIEAEFDIDYYEYFLQFFDLFGNLFTTPKGINSGISTLNTTGFTPGEYQIRLVSVYDTILFNDQYVVKDCTPKLDMDIDSTLCVNNLYTYNINIENESNGHFLEIFDSIGNAYSFPELINSGEATINTTDIIPGIYYLRFISDYDTIYYPNQVVIKSCEQNTTFNPLQTIFSEAIKVYPNPSSDFINILVSTYQPYSIPIEIFNSNGILFKKTLIKYSQPIKVEDLPNGIYFVKIVFSDFVIVKSFIKEN